MVIEIRYSLAQNVLLLYFNKRIFSLLENVLRTLSATIFNRKLSQIFIKIVFNVRRYLDSRVHIQIRKQINLKGNFSGKNIEDWIQTGGGRVGEGGKI